MKDENTGLYNLAACANELHIHIKGLEQQAEAGKIPCLAIGRKKKRFFFNIIAVKSKLAELAANGGDTMNVRQTIIEANRQIRLLMRNCTPREQQWLRKYIRPVPKLGKQMYHEANRLADILPVVMADIRQHMERRRGSI